MMTNNIAEIIKLKASSDKKSSILQLYNNKHECVAAIYLRKLKDDIENLVICETKTTEKYSIYLFGILIFFTYYSFE